MDADFDLYERRFRSSIVKNTIACVYGKPIPKDTWRNWREWANYVAPKLPGFKNVRTSERTYSYQQFCGLYAIAVLRRREREQQVTHYPPLKSSDIILLAKDQDMHAEISGLIKMIDSEFVVGADADKALHAIEGISVSLRTIQRNVPGFSTSKLYRLDYLKRFVNGRKTA
jgi:hypothetical protein